MKRFLDGFQAPAVSHDAVAIGPSATGRHAGLSRDTEALLQKSRFRLLPDRL